MKIAVGCDHRGYALKEKIKKYLKQEGHEVVDCGTDSEKSANYPEHILPAAELIGSGKCQKGIGICYTGIGSSIAANKVFGVRASLCKTVEEAALTRAHNDSNMLILGAGFMEETLAMEVLKKWLATPFEGGRHQDRIKAITDYETKKK